MQSRPKEDGMVRLRQHGSAVKGSDLEEVIRRPSRDHRFAGARTGFELQAVGVKEGIS